MRTSVFIFIKDVVLYSTREAIFSHIYKKYKYFSFQHDCGRLFFVADHHEEWLRIIPRNDLIVTTS